MRYLYTCRRWLIPSGLVMTANGAEVGLKAHLVVACPEGEKRCGLLMGVVSAYLPACSSFVCSSVDFVLFVSEYGGKRTI